MMMMVSLPIVLLTLILQRTTLLKTAAPSPPVHAMTTRFHWAVSVLRNCLLNCGWMVWVSTLTICMEQKSPSTAATNKTRQLRTGCSVAFIGSRPCRMSKTSIHCVHRMFWCGWMQIAMKVAMKMRKMIAEKLNLIKD